jgi:5-methylthioadenosine/S-adenosylhomocysteine deaminase
MKAIVRCARALVDGEEVRDYAFAVEDGRIAAIGPADVLAQRFPGVQAQTYGDHVLVLPGFINGHSHAYQILLRGWADDLPFSRWRSDALYKIVPHLTPEDIYWTFRLAFDEMLAGGITTVAEFFYLNGAGNAHAEHAIRAARDAGIRLVFARTWMDAEYAPAAFRESIEVARLRTLALMQDFPDVQICVAPHSLHAASLEMIGAAAEFARAQNCMMHIHVAEAKYEGAQTQERFGATPISLLQRLGALDERTVAIHAIHITDEEKRLLADAGARVVHNPMTNQYLGDGICDVTGLQALGVQMGLGTDADVRPSIIEEMRAASLLQKIAHLDGSALGARAALELGTAQGAAALRVNAGAFLEGMHADYIVVDVSEVDPWIPLANHVVYRAENFAVRETYVAGVRVRVHEESAPQQALQALKSLVPRLRL